MAEASACRCCCPDIMRILKSGAESSQSILSTSAKKRPDLLEKARSDRRRKSSFWTKFVKKNSMISI